MFRKFGNSFFRIQHAQIRLDDISEHFYQKMHSHVAFCVISSSLQGAPETNHSIAPDKMRLQAEGISNQPSFTEIGLCAHQPPNLLNDLRVGLFSATLQRHHGECPTFETLGIG